MDTRPAGRILTLIVGEVMAYISVVFHLPVLIGAIALAGIVTINLQELYPRVFAVTVSPLLGFLPQRFEFQLPDLWKACVVLSIAWYVIKMPFRWIRGDRPAMRYRVQLAWTALFVTLCWAVVFAHLPWMRMAPGASRAGLGGVFAGFYVMTLVAFAAGLTFAWLGDRVLDFLRRQLDPEPPSKGGIA
jgi:hypothetical protein